MVLGLESSRDVVRGLLVRLSLSLAGVPGSLAGKMSFGCGFICGDSGAVTVDVVGVCV